MPILLVVAVILLERARLDLHVRRWWARLPLRRPALAVAVPVPIALAGLDVRRWAVRVVVLPISFVLYAMFARPYRLDEYEGVNGLVGFYLALIGLGVLAIVAALAGRDREVELLAALPAGPRSRVLGWTALLTVLALAEYALLVLSRYGRDEPAYAILLPDLWELAQGPVVLLGGGLLGLLLARLMPGAVAAPVGVVLGIAWVAWLSRDGATTVMLAPMIEWIQYREDDLVVVEPGSLSWHNAYLLGLCGLGLVAALLREPGRRRGLVAAGAVLLAGTAAAGALALP